MANRAVSFFVNLSSGDKGSEVSPPTSARGRIKAIQCKKRDTLMQFPGARRLACRKRLRNATSFLKEQGANENELCICLYVTGCELPEKFDFMTKDSSLTCPSGSPLLAEYLLNDEPVRVQIMKNEVKLGCLAPPVNKIGGWKKPKQAVSFFVNFISSEGRSDVKPPSSAWHCIKAMQSKNRKTLMQFPGARRLACRKRLRNATAFLKEQVANADELCICLYVIGSELPEKFEFMTKDRALTLPRGSPLLAEYTFNDDAVRVQIMKYKVKLGCLAPPVNKIGGLKKSNAVSFTVKLPYGSEVSDVSRSTSALGRIKAMQRSKRKILMKFPGARLLACRKRLRNATSFLKEQGASENELCICLYVTGFELPDKFECLTKNDSTTCPSGSPLLAEYFINDEAVRVQIMKYKARLGCLAPPVNKIGGWKKPKKAVSFFVDLNSGDEGPDAIPPKSARGQMKAIQCRKRNILMQFPGARRLACRKRLSTATSFLKEQGADEKELCICLYVTGKDLPDKFEFMTKDSSLTCPSGSPLLAEYLLNDEPVRVQIMKYKVKLGSLAPPLNKIVGRKKPTKKAVSFFVDLNSGIQGFDICPPASDRGQIKAMQYRNRNILMRFPGARRLACRKRLSSVTPFLKEQGASKNELCMCVYVTGNELPENFGFMNKDSSLTCPSGTPLLAEYILNGISVRVQIMKYEAKLGCLAPPENKIGGLKKSQQR